MTFCSPLATIFVHLSVTPGPLPIYLPLSIYLPPLSVGTYQLVWYVAREGILYPPPVDVSYNSQQLVIPNIGYNHEAVYYGESHIFYRVLVD